MTQELLSTSAPAGLHPGTSGFCTVVQSRDLPQPTAELLETLSGYRAVFLPGDPREAENPPALSHVRLTSRGRTVSVLSRVAATDRDYTGRSNRVAHHVVLDGGDARPAAGPGWLATVPGFLERTWDGQVRWLPTGRAVPPGDAPGGCPTWQRLTGDPGWAAVLADAMMKGKPYYLVYDLGMDVAALIAEALRQVPPHLRWDVTFTTYYTGLPSGVRCDVRAVLRGTAEERSAPASAKLDVASLRGRPAPAVEVPAAPPLRTPSRVAAVAAQAAAAAAPEPVAAPAVVPEQPPQVEVEEQLRQEFGLKPAKSPKPKGGSGGLALLVTMTMVVVAASGIGGWLLFTEGNKPDGHAGTKDNGKEPPKDAEVKKEGGKKDGTTAVVSGPKDDGAKDGGTKVEPKRFPVLPYPTELPAPPRKIAFAFTSPRKDVLEGESLTLSVEGDDTFKDWSLVKVEGVGDGAKIEQGKLTLKALKPGEHRIKLAAGKTADRFWDEVTYTVSVQARENLRLVAVTDLDRRMVLNGWIECRVKAMKGDKQVKGHQVRFFVDGEPAGQPMDLVMDPKGVKLVADQKDVKPGKHKVEVRLISADPGKVSAEPLSFGEVVVAKVAKDIITISLQIDLSAGKLSSTPVKFEQKWKDLDYPTRPNHFQITGPIKLTSWARIVDKKGNELRNVSAEQLKLPPTTDGVLRATDEKGATYFWVEYVPSQQLIAKPRVHLSEWIQRDRKAVRAAFEEGIGKAVVILPVKNQPDEVGLAILFNVTFKEETGGKDKE